LVTVTITIRITVVLQFTAPSYTATVNETDPTSTIVQTVKANPDVSLYTV